MREPGNTELLMELGNPRPSLAEHLIAEYGHKWEIWRELGSGGVHGLWKARQWDGRDELSASTIEELAAALQKADPPESETPL